VAKKKVATQIGTNDAHLLSAPPISFQGPPVAGSDEARNDNFFVAVSKHPALPKPVDGSIEGIRLVHHGG
jgi:hypothetical protein